MMTDSPLPPLVRAVIRLENASALDSAVSALRLVAGTVRGSMAGEWLAGRPVGHALHPALTDIPIGFWTSAALLDIAGRNPEAARTLVGAGILSAVPTALTGLAELRDVQVRELRVAVTHAGLNSAALALYVASWVARTADRQRTGILLGLAGAGAASVSGYLGGHLSVARKIGTRHPAFTTRDV